MRTRITNFQLHEANMSINNEQCRLGLISRRFWKLQGRQPPLPSCSAVAAYYDITVPPMSSVCILSLYFTRRYIITLRYHGSRVCIT